MTKARTDRLMGSLARSALTLSLLAGCATAQQAPDPAWAEVGRILKTAETPTGGYHRYNFPRSNVVLKMGDVTVAAGLVLGAWAGFDGTAKSAEVMGDLVLLPSELKSVLAELDKQGFGVTAIHGHLTGEVPEIIYVHYHGEGVATELATKLDKVFAITGIPRPVVAGAPAPLTIDTAMVFKALGASGKASGAVAQLSFMLVSEPVMMHGHKVLATLGYGTPINVQMVSPTRMVATGDFSVTGRQIAPILAALTAHGISATQLHSHLMDESPHIYYMHFWADGAPAEVLAGLRAALDAAKVK